MASLLEKLTAEGGGESVRFLNDIVAQLWPHINVAGCKMIKEIAEPMFKTMLPGPLASLHFTKLDLGHVPLELSNLLVTKTETDGIKLDLNVDWAGKCDIALDASMIPTVGVRGVALHGRLSVLLGPLTDIIPLIGAAQIAFVNPPVLKLDFTGAANVADSDMIDGAVRSVIMSIINSMLVLPNRLMIKLDATSDYFKTQIYPLGILRLTVEKASGFAEEKQSASKRFLSKITRASPDTYCNVSVGAETTWRTSTKNNTTNPSWNEVHDFVVTDMNQCITVDLMDHDVGSDDQIGLAVTTVKDILLTGGKQELSMVHKEQPIDGSVSLSCKFYHFAPDNSSFSASDHSGEGRLCGIATIMIAGVLGIPGRREELNPSVVVTWGEKHRFQTAMKTDAPGTDISNPSFDQSFRIPYSADMVSGGGQSFRIALMNKKDEVGSIDIPLSDVLSAPDMIVQNNFGVGGGAAVRASISLRGLTAADI
ncbi:C2 (Calcium/lipid-binding, CaLB) [Glarea lozoyensis ATCC 20868]|uniref:C2 (Calcium/lipid-binding, CaLB) n=1 Tax=Glarea lozoyensis (strain ATCC 20868 / MF5171) TaxID=1116229 RepID=S3CLA1_GLAL2|nr:C2 (Calcium/lipid-binding, CaLB) [Glarea lozoyensis ATCC 20868]EPE26535.1 C2 (Calcium/lipid-binding, CaLB) [Glarea lozoyensis ATCC 20868]